MDNQELQQYQQLYNFIIEPEGRLTRPETGKTYFFDDREFDTKYIGRVTNTGNRGITLILQKYVSDITSPDVIIKRKHLVGREFNKFVLPDSIVHLDNDSLKLVNAYLIPTDNNDDSDTSTVGYISEATNTTDEFEEDFGRLTLGKRDATSNITNNSKKYRQQGGKKSKRRKTRKVKRRSHRIKRRY